MMKGKFLNLVLVILILTAALSYGAQGAWAHNAGHIHLSTGECVDTGSGNHAHNPEEQDKIPGPGDQYGTRWAAELANTPIWPRHCDETGAHNHP